LNFNRVLFRGNKATDTTGGGGAIWLASAAATASFTNVTFAGNKANNHGGAIYLNFPGATVNLNNVTMSGNISNDDNIPGLNSGDGGGFAKFGGNLLSKNSVVAGNIDTDNTSTYAPDCIAGVGVGVTNLGNNLVGDPTNCTFDTPPATGNPMLGPLASNGGPSQTMALLTGSPLLNAGNALTPGSGGSACDGVDQRGFPRGGGAGVCDIGAFEAQPVPPAPITSASAPTGQRAAALKKCKKKKSAKKRKKCKKKAKLLPV
jgi:predicted outer membrane repeat protein